MQRKESHMQPSEVGLGTQRSTALHTEFSSPITSFPLLDVPQVPHLAEWSPGWGMGSQSYFL